jgi:hypothetical protein
MVKDFDPVNKETILTKIDIYIENNEKFERYIRDNIRKRKTFVVLMDQIKNIYNPLMGVRADELDKMEKARKIKREKR